MKHKTDYKWIITITLMSVISSMLFSLAASEALDGAGYVVAVALLMVFILIGIVFDMLGMAVTCAKEAPFHSMASHRERGAAEALRLLRDSEKVASIANDVVGDISGIVSGATAATIAGNFTRDFSLSGVLTQLIVTGCVAGLTIGGKALGKTVAVNNSTQIVLFTGRLLSFLPKRKKRKSK